MTYGVTILSAWLLADFLTGLGHWAEDKLLKQPSRFRFLEGIRLDNELHHRLPAAFLRLSWWKNINTTCAITCPLALILFLVGAPKVVCLAAFFASFANLVHRFAHLPPARLNAPIKLLQAVGLFPTFKHHWVHHADANGLIEKQNTTGRYCPLTCWLNPILDRSGFWRVMDRLFAPT